MYNLFTNYSMEQRGRIQAGQVDYIRRTYQQQVFNIIDHYNTRVIAVRSNHLLVRLLTTLNIPLTYELHRYVESANVRAPYIAKHFKFSSELSYGDFFTGEFYGERCKELIISTDGYFDSDISIKNWKTIKAVNVLEHPISDLGLCLPNGKDNSTDYGLAVIEINIPLLLVQYRGFLMDHMINNTESQLGATHFVHMYVLPNMLYSHIDLVMVNRFSNIVNGAPMGDTLSKHPFQIIDYSDRIDRLLQYIYKYFNNKPTDFSTYLSNIPTIYHDSSKESLMMPDVTPTRQIWWSLLLTRLRYINVLIKLAGSRGVRHNRKDIYKLKTDLKRLLNENIIENKLPEEYRYDIMENINDLLYIF